MSPLTELSPDIGSRLFGGILGSACGEGLAPCLQHVRPSVDLEAHRGKARPVEPYLDAPQQRRDVLDVGIQQRTDDARRVALLEPRQPTRREERHQGLSPESRRKLEDNDLVQCSGELHVARIPSGRAPALDLNRSICTRNARAKRRYASRAAGCTVGMRCATNNAMTENSARIPSACRSPTIRAPLYAVSAASVVLLLTCASFSAFSRSASETNGTPPSSLT